MSWLFINRSFGSFNLRYWFCEGNLPDNLAGVQLDSLGYFQHIMVYGFPITVWL
jgi:hypothetical protein